MSEEIQHLYDELRAADAALDIKRDEYYAAAKVKNDCHRKLSDAMSPGDIATVQHDADHQAIITARHHPALPGHHISIRVEGQTASGSPQLTFGKEPEGEKIHRRKM